MARVEVKMPDDFMNKISRLGDKTDEIVPLVLEAGGEVALAAVRRNLQAVIGRGTEYPSRSTGELVGALGLSPAKMDNNGNFNVKVGFAEPRSAGSSGGGGESNAKIANIIENGKHGQPPKPFLKLAKSQAKGAVAAAMIAKLESEIKDV
ncbi:MAG: HK97 gp10 family phage protein [Eubacteriales bacterium]|nr:HK97 gp10 family phage protein [Eubacteriales bacterium]